MSQLHMRNELFELGFIGQIENNINLNSTSKEKMN